MSRALIFALASALTLISAPAFAFPNDDVRQEVVRYGDLNIKTPDGANALVDRIENASDNVCSDPGSITTSRSAERQCERVAEADAVAQVGVPTVTGAYYGYTPNVVIDDGGTPAVDSKK